MKQEKKKITERCAKNYIIKISQNNNEECCLSNLETRKYFEIHKLVDKRKQRIYVCKICDFTISVIDCCDIHQK